MVCYVKISIIITVEGVYISLIRKHENNTRESKKKNYGVLSIKEGNC